MVRVTAVLEPPPECAMAGCGRGLPGLASKWLERPELRVGESLLVLGVRARAPQAFQLAIKPELGLRLSCSFDSSAPQPAGAERLHTRPKRHCPAA